MPMELAIAAKSGAAEIPSGEELVARAKALAPALKARAAAADLDRRLPKETIADFAAAGLFRILQPRRWGGYEMDPQVFFDVQIALGEADASSGWVYGIIGCHNYQMGLFDLRAQEDVWGKDTSVRIASSYQPVGKVERTEGGFYLSGRWSFSSGCDHCDWIFLGSLIPPARDGEPPEMRTFLLPRKDYEIVDTWRTFGLKATGSNDIVVNRAFVPDYRTHKAIDGFFCTNPGQAVNTAPLYRLPWAQIFVRSISTSSIGAARGAVAAYIEAARTRVSTNTGKATKSDPTATLALARTQMELDGMVAVLHRNFDRMMALARAGEAVPTEERLLYVAQSSTVARRCADMVDELIQNLGGRAIYSEHPVQRYWLDLNAARAHVANDPSIAGGNLGTQLLGEPVHVFFA
jgi:3-hydroxy-9,10-secoandrosta-1,3,5(10)-triene-9,17-dione monooxygenase